MDRRIQQMREGILDDMRQLERWRRGTISDTLARSTEAIQQKPVDTDQLLALLAKIVS